MRNIPTIKKSVDCRYGYRQRFTAANRVGAASLSLFAAVAGQRMPPPNNDRRLQMITNRYPDGWPFLAHCINPHGDKGLFNYELRQCEQDESPPFDTSSRIAIVGGGPSGIYMAKLLHDRGFNQLTLFEKEDRVGGKSKNLILDDGEKLDLGTIYTANKYECVELLAAEVGISERPVNVDGKTPRRVSSKESILVDMEAPNFGEFNEWSADYAFRNYGVDPTTYRDTFLAEAQAYVAYWTETMGSFEYMFPDKETVDFEALNQSFLSWLEERNLHALIPRMIIGTSGQGYGNLETMPAYYGLMWIHPNFLGGSGTQSMLLESWQTMFERILATTRTTVKIKTQVVKIGRNTQGVVIDYIDRSSKSQGKGKTTELYDFLIMAAPMPTALKMLKKSTNEERELFGSYNYKSVRYDIGYLESTGDVDVAFNLFSWMDRHDKQTDYHVASLNDDGDTDRHVLARDGIDGALTMNRQGRIRATDGDFSPSAGIFSISPIGTTKEEVRSQLKADLAEYGMDMSFVHTEIWPDYLPWKNLTQVVDGKMPWRIYDAQGTESFPKTWYVGSYVSFESVADILDYNLKMVNEKLCVEKEELV